MTTRICAALLAAMACVLPLSAVAQVSPLIIDQNRTDRRPPTVPNKSNRPLHQPKAQNSVREIKPFTVTEVRISGSTIDPGALGAVARGFVGETADGKTINAITDAIAGVYEQSDVALYTVVAPEQDFAGGIVNVTVIEGYIQHADIHGDIGGHLDLVKAYAAKLTQERPLRKSTLQRYVSLIRDIAGLTPDIQLLSGNQPGAVELSIGLSQKDYQVGIAINTRGAQELGRIQFGTDLTLYDLFQEGDATKIGFAAPTELKYFQYYTFSETQPVGEDGLMGQINLGYLRTRPKDGLPSGHAENGQLLFSYPLIRGFEENLYVSASFDALDSRNALLGQTLANEKVRALRAAAAYSQQEEKHALSLAGTLSLGIDGLGAHVTSPALSQSDFKKINLQGAFAQQFGDHWIARLSMAAQYTESRLPVSEFFALGGGDYGRGFPAASIYGDRGLAGSAELAYRLSDVADFLTSTELYTFADDGAATLTQRSGLIKRGFSLSSAGFGVRFGIGAKTTLYVEAEKPLHVPQVPGLDRGWQLGFGFRGNY